MVYFNIVIALYLKALGKRLAGWGRGSVPVPLSFKLCLVTFQLLLL